MVEIGGVGNLQLVGLEIEALSADHAGGARGGGKSAHQSRPDVRVCVGLGARQQPKATVSKRIAGEDRRPFVEGVVHGGLAPAQVIIVHGGQVVVHQRITMYAFDGGRGGERGRPDDTRTSPPFQQQKWPQALAAPSVAWRMAWIRRGGVPSWQGSQAAGRSGHRQVAQRLQVVG